MDPTWEGLATFVRRLLATFGVLALTLLAAPTAAAQADTQYDPEVVVPNIRALSPVVVYSATQDKVFAKVRYQCTNTAKMESYLLLSFVQGQRPYYSMGSRGDNGGTMKATCNGKWVNQTIGMVRSSYTIPGDPYPTLGKGHFGFGIAQLSIPSLGGWYIAQGPGARLERDVWVARVR